MSGKLSRSEQREQVLQLVYEKSFHDEPVDELLELANIARDYVPTGFVSDEISGIENNIEKTLQDVHEVKEVQVTSKPSPVELYLDKMDPLNMSPMEALSALMELKKLLEK